MTHHGTRVGGVEVERRDCPCCEAVGTLTSSFEVERFLYGAGDEAVTLEARLPVWSCSACGDAYVEGEAEELRHEAVCIHLGRPTPSELRAFRKARGLSQAALAELTGYGIASIKRWETSAQVPSASAATSLRQVMSAVVDRPAQEPRFRTPFSTTVLRRAASFRLSFGSAPSQLQAA